jgi:hypothetical protein
MTTKFETKEELIAFLTEDAIAKFDNEFIENLTLECYIVESGNKLKVGVKYSSTYSLKLPYFTLTDSDYDMYESNPVTLLGLSSEPIYIKDIAFNVLDILKLIEFKGFKTPIINNKICQI